MMDNRTFSKGEERCGISPGGLELNKGAYFSDVRSLGYNASFDLLWLD